MLIDKITGKTQICNRNVETRRIKKFLKDGGLLVQTVKVQIQ